MANEEQLSILKQGVDVWNRWREENLNVEIDLNEANLIKFDLYEVNLSEANLSEAFLSGADLRGAVLSEADLSNSKLIDTDLRRADLTSAHLNGADLSGSNLTETDLTSAGLGKTDFNSAYLIGAIFSDARFSATNLSRTNLSVANFGKADLGGSNFLDAVMNMTTFRNSDLSQAIGLDDVVHKGPSTIGTDTIAKSKGKIPEVFLRGCGLSDWEIESAKLYNPELNNEGVNKILYKMYDLRASQALQIAPLFISYSHGDGAFVDRLESYLNKKGVRFWRDIHDMKSGRMEKQIDRAMRLNPTVLLILSEHSLKSDWVEHEVRTARSLEKEMKRDVLCPVTIDDSWKNSPWSKRIMEQIMEYNILDFSEWNDDAKFGSTFNKLIDGLELFYK